MRRSCQLFGDDKKKGRKTPNCMSYEPWSSASDIFIENWISHLSVRQKFIKPGHKCDRFDTSHRDAITHSFMINGVHLNIGWLAWIREHMLQISCLFCIDLNMTIRLRSVLLNQLFYDLFFSSHSCHLYLSSGSQHFQSHFTTWWRTCLLLTLI